MTSGIDWEQAQERLRSSERALDEALNGSPARIHEVFRERARQLSIGVRLEPRREPLSTLIFSLQGERYAIELKELLEVLPFQDCTPVPGAPPEFAGVMKVRGELRPIVDLGRVIPAAEKEESRAGFVLMLRRPGWEMGLKVERVESLLEIPSEKVDVAEPGRFCKTIAGETLLLLDMERVLAEVFSAGEAAIA